MKSQFRLIRWFYALFQKRKLDAEMDEEMRSHVELRTQQNIGSGMSVEEAQFVARRQFGLGVSLLLLFVTLLASWFPARRAARVNLMLALRDE